MVRNMCVVCNNCSWRGEEEDLDMFYAYEVFSDDASSDEIVSKEYIPHTTGEFIKACPICETDSYLMDEEPNLT